MNTLTFTPSWSTQVEHDDRVLISKFGDGYEQRAPEGINAKRMKWSLVWSNTRTARAAEVVAFFRTQGRVEPFLWTPPAPYNVETRWVLASTVQHRYHGHDNESVTVLLEQDFNPA